MENFTKVQEFGSEYHWGKEIINGNVYILILTPYSDEMHPVKDKVRIEIWGSMRVDDYTLPDSRVDFIGNNNNSFKKLVEFEEKSYKYDAIGRDFSTLLSKLLNKAVCRLEEKEQDEQSFLDGVKAAVQANKEVHEGIDYQLEEN